MYKTAKSFIILVNSITSATFRAQSNISSVSSNNLAMTDCHKMSMQMLHRAHVLVTWRKQPASAVSM
jgi:hypothetical protein